MSEETIKPPCRRENSFDPEIIYNYDHGKVQCERTCLKPDSVSFRYMVKRFKHRFYTS